MTNTHTQMMAAGGGSSSFDSLGMPKIRPRGSKGEEKPAEEAPATAAEVAPVRLRVSVCVWIIWMDGMKCVHVYL